MTGARWYPDTEGLVSKAHENRTFVGISEVVAKFPLIQGKPPEMTKCRMETVRNKLRK
jgi:hypothetical protein